ncbi:MAG TPA: hypothetical protein VEA61_11565 [Allosphingosinicella sp.]|nr:hypothetical protein [Allosphingosinicella sp.]
MKLEGAGGEQLARAHRRPGREGGLIGTARIDLRRVDVGDADAGAAIVERVAVEDSDEPGGSDGQGVGLRDRRRLEAANMRLTRQRVAGVRAALVAAGIAPPRIIAESFGESRSITALDYGRLDPEHRYVLVKILSPREARKCRAGKARTNCGG